MTIYDVANLWSATTNGDESLFVTTTATDDDVSDVDIDHYKVFGNKTVVVWFTDGTKSVAVCSDDDTFDLRSGIEMAMLKAAWGDDVHSYVDKVIKMQDKEELAIKQEAARAKANEEARQQKAKKLHDKKIKREAKRQLEIEAAKLAFCRKTAGDTLLNE